MPRGYGWRERTEEAMAEREDGAQAGAIGDGRIDRFEPALDIALQCVVLQRLVMRLMRRQFDRTVCAGGESGMTASAEAAFCREIRIRAQLIPAFRKSEPVSEFAGCSQQWLHGVRGHEREAIALYGVD
jgi:hypothetical protein